MISAVEGNVNVGKTTFITEMANINNLKIIKETEFPINQMEAFNRQVYYINKEVEKNDKYKNDEGIMDRTILSVYLYTLLSDEFKKEEQEKLTNLINELIINNKIIVPDKLFFIIYPYDLINKNHLMLKSEKHTQNTLVEYEYYLKYNLFFANLFKQKRAEIIKTENIRQVILFKGNEIYYRLKAELPQSSSIILLDGAPAIGKSTICKIQKQYKYIEEFKYKKYSLKDYINQIESIISRIKILKNENVIIDTSFLMGITHLFYSHKEEVSKEQKIKMLKEIIKNIPLCLYTTKIVYLYTDKSILISRKNNDKNKKREHFYENMEYLEKELNFYKKLNEKMGDISNIHLIEANKTSDKIIDEINSLEKKELLLVDLFYYILKCIEEGEI